MGERIGTAFEGPLIQPAMFGTDVIVSSTWVTFEHRTGLELMTQGSIQFDMSSSNNLSPNTFGLRAIYNYTSWCCKS